MSRTVSRGGEAAQHDGAVAAGKAGQGRPRGRRRRAVAMVLVLVVLGAGAGVAWAAGAFGSQGSSGTGQGAPPPATQAVLAVPRQELVITGALALAAFMGQASIFH